MNNFFKRPNSLKWVVSTVIILFLSSSVALSQNLKALVGGTLIDGFGSTPIQNSVIIIEGDQIIEVGQIGAVTIPESADIISTEGMSVLPGLWDMHVHLMLSGHTNYEHWHPTYLDKFESVIMPASAHQLLMAGITSARDLGAPLDASINVRDAINNGEIPGPTMYMSGPFVQNEPYPGTSDYRWGIDNVADAREKVKTLYEAGVDVIKLLDHDQMTMDEVKAVVDESHNYGLKVVAHAHRPEEIRRGLEAGIDNFEHTGLATAPEYPADVMEKLKERTADMSIGPLYWTPTISVLYNYEYMRDHPLFMGEKSWQLDLPDSIIQDIEQSLEHPDRFPYFQLSPLRKGTLKRKFDQLREAGVVMLVGTDSGVPMYFHSQATWQELDVWVNHLGVDPMTAIRAATYWPARFMGVENEVGTISEGKTADIIAVKGDVLRHISLLRNVDIVIKHGKLYK